MKSAIPAGICLIGLLTCSWLALRNRVDLRKYKVEITVHGPDGTVIPPVRPSSRP